MKFFLSKTFVLLLVFALVQIPLHSIENITNERLSFKNQAINSVSGSYAGHQFLSGPALVFPYTYTYWQEVRNKDGDPVGREQISTTGSISILPKNLQVDSDVVVEERKVGIFPVPVFKAALTLTSSFDWDALQSPVVLKPDDKLEWGQPYLALPISDQHGLKNIDAITWNGEGIHYAPGSRIHLYGGQGVHADVKATSAAGKAESKIQLALIGTELLQILPTADQSSINIHSNWPHPQFLGAQLPDKRDITEQGFTANWQSTILATNINALWDSCYAGAACNSLQAEAFGVQMIDPTNFYTKMSRALKYGFLFLAITFIAFVLFEVLCDLRIHPVQYTLLGIASGIFFLLLLSLAEHLGFAMAYAIAAGACLILLTLYANALLKQWQRTLGFSAVLTSLYGVLFTILEQEDAALLTGSLLIFGLLTVTMMITRNIDWYAWQEKLSKPAA